MEIQKEKDAEEAKDQERIDIEDMGSSFNAEIKSFKLENGVALFEIEPEGIDRTYVSTMEATVDIQGKSEFEKFLHQQGIEDMENPFDEYPIPCTVATRRENDIVKFELESLDIVDDRDGSPFEEISSFAIGSMAGLAPVINIFFFSAMLSHVASKDKTENTDVMFLFGMVVMMTTTFISAVPLI